MRKFSKKNRLLSLEPLEQKLSLSSLVMDTSGGSVQSAPVIVQPMDDDPPPDPEPAPPANPVNGPIQYPTLPPSGPLGPG
jgi:hypothetical protein